mmetsp:Transcript_27224/g.41908  ORF Transcript_27224/g.41908 Transcript_27224/m.41908 type:complete len:80 (-) Transcript_27224:53-292(-)
MMFVLVSMMMMFVVMFYYRHPAAAAIGDRWLEPPFVVDWALQKHNGDGRHRQTKIELSIAAAGRINVWWCVVGIAGASL